MIPRRNNKGRGAIAASIMIIGTQKLPVRVMTLFVVAVVVLGD